MKKLIFLLFSFALSFGSNAQVFCSVSVTPMDTIICLGDSVQMTAVANLITNSGQQFNFNGGALPPGWSTTGGGAYASPCEPSLDGTSYYWASTAGATPQIATAAFDVTCGGSIMFDMDYAIQSQPFPCEGMEVWDEGVELQYSVSGGPWTPIIYYAPDGNSWPSKAVMLASGTWLGVNAPFSQTTYVPAGTTNAYTSWSSYSVPIPAAAQSASTSFRWIQTASSSATNDNWGLDNIIINSTGTPCGNNTVVNWSNGLMDINQYYLTPTGDSTFIALVYDTMGNFQCQSQPITINVHPDAMTYTLPDTIYSYCRTTSPSAQVTNFGGTFGPWGVNWTDIPSTNNPIVLPISGVEQETLVYHVDVTDGCNYLRQDSVVVIVNQTLAVDTMYTFPSSACEPDGAVSGVAIGLTMTSGQPFYNWTGPGINPGPYNVDASVLEDIPSGWYYFTVTDDVCTVTDSAFVEPIDPPMAQFTSTPASGCMPLNVNFVNLSQNANNYYWDFGNGQTASVGNTNSQDQSFNFSSTVMLIAYQSPTCADTAYTSISVVLCGCTDPDAVNYDPNAILDDGNCQYPDPVVVVPNVFTPNGDLSNGLFELQLENTVQLQLTITNRWGNIMYSADQDLTQLGSIVGWDGKTPSGRNAEEGTYFYTYVATGIVGQKVEGHGFLELIRD